jgi:hypothetical protein
VFKSSNALTMPKLLSATAQNARGLSAECRVLNANYGVTDVPRNSG